MPEQNRNKTDYQDKSRRDTYLSEMPGSTDFGAPSGKAGDGNVISANSSGFQPYPFPTASLAAAPMPGNSNSGNGGRPGTMPVTRPGNQRGPVSSQPGESEVPIPSKPGESEEAVPPQPGEPEQPMPSQPARPGMPVPSQPARPGMPTPSQPSRPGAPTPSQPSRPPENVRPGFCTLRFIHAAVGQPPVRISIGSKPLVPRLEYGEVSSYFMETDGFKRISVSSVENGRAAVYQEIFLFFDGDVYTIAIVNSKDGIALFPINDAPCSNSRQNFSCVRAANLSYNSPALDVALVDGMVQFEDLRFRNVAAYKQIMRGWREFYVSESESGAMVLAEAKQIEPGKMYTMYLIGDAYAYPGIQAVFTEDYPEM